jgi:hypothetical protein
VGQESFRGGEDNASEADRMNLTDIYETSRTTSVGRCRRNAVNKINEHHSLCPVAQDNEARPVEHSSGNQTIRQFAKPGTLGRKPQFRVRIAAVEVT